MFRRFGLILSAALAGTACSTDLPDAPKLTSIMPDMAPVNRRTEVTIRGENITHFAKTNFNEPGASIVSLVKIQLGMFELTEIRTIEKGVIQAVAEIPASGVYDLIVTDEFDREARLMLAFRAREASCEDLNVAGNTDCAACASLAGCECNDVALCAPICGDGALRFPETCDDGDADPGDGCAANCLTETGFVCDMGMPSTCLPVCSDGQVVGGEGCDDGNQTLGDGCDASC